MNHSGRLGLACQTSCSRAIFLDAETLLRTCLCFACAITRSTFSFLSTKLDWVSICLSVYIHYFSIYLSVTLHMKSHSSFLSQPLIWIWWEQKLVFSIWFWSDLTHECPLHYESLSIYFHSVYELNEKYFICNLWLRCYNQQQSDQLGHMHSLPNMWYATTKVSTLYLVQSS